MLFCVGPGPVNNLQLEETDPVDPDNHDITASWGEPSFGNCLAVQYSIRWERDGDEIHSKDTIELNDILPLTDPVECSVITVNVASFVGQARSAEQTESLNYGKCHYTFCS